MPDTQLEAIARIRAQWKDVVQAVIAACQGDADAAAQLSSTLDQMSRKDDWRALADALRRILHGARDRHRLVRQPGQYRRTTSPATCCARSAWRSR